MRERQETSFHVFYNHRSSEFPLWVVIWCQSTLKMRKNVKCERSLLQRWTVSLPSFTCPPWAPSARSSGCSSGGERLGLVRASPDWKWQHEGISSSPQTPATWFAFPSSRATKVDFLPSCSTSSSAYYLPHSTPQLHPGFCHLGKLHSFGYAQGAGVISSSGSRAPNRRPASASCQIALDSSTRHSTIEVKLENHWLCALCIALIFLKLR